MTIVEIDGRRAHVREAGEPGPVALLAHGSLSHGGEWSGLIADCEDRFHLIAPDLPGYGRSDPASEDGRPCFVSDASLFCSLADSESEEHPIHLVGRDYGATIAIRVALTLPDRVASLTLIEPYAFYLLEEAGAPERLETAAMGYRALALAGFEDKKPPARMMWDFMHGEGAFDAAPPETQAYVSHVVDRLAADWRALAFDAPGQLRRADLARLDMPVQIVLRMGARAPVRAAAAILRDSAPDCSISSAPSSDLLSAMIARALDAHQTNAMRTGWRVSLPKFRMMRPRAS